MLHKKLAIPAAVVVAISSGASLSHPSGVTHARAASDYSGTISISDYQVPDALPFGGAYGASVANTEVAAAVGDTALGVDASGKLFPDLATTVPTTANGGIKVVGGSEIITIHLKPNQKWSDGSPITLADYIFPTVLQFSPDVNNVDPANQIKSITGSGNDITVTFKKIYAPALYYVISSGALAPLPIEFMEKKYGAALPANLLNSYNSSTSDTLQSSAGTFFGTPYKGSTFQTFATKWLADHYISPSDVFNGPYKVGEWTTDQRYVLVPNTFYTALPAAAGHPRPAKIQFVVVSENQPTLLQDVTADSTYNSVDKIEDFSVLDLATLYKSKYQVLVPQALQYEHLEFNVGRAPYNDIRVRQALYYALDKQKYLTALFPAVKDWRSIALTSPTPSVSPYSINNQFPLNPFNLAKARSLLAAAGYGPGGKHLTVNLYTTTSSFRLRSGGLLQRIWAQVGVSTHLHYVPAQGQNGLFSTYVDGSITYRHLFDVAEFTSQENVDPDQAVFNYEISQIGSPTNPTGANYDQIRDPHLESLFARARVTLDDNARKAIYADYQRYFVQQAYQISLFNRPNVVVVKGTVGNFKPNVTQAGFEWNAFQWWYDGSNSQKQTVS